YAQIYGKYNTSAEDKLKMDLMYIENYSFLRDIQIILMTIKIMIFPTQKTNEELEELLENFENQRNQL
ncbi:MAG: sugar transferase, partial [Oscillospiraceae bacterium]|nr:sugar transferase [Oscillospiraceae bacterium]